MTERLALLQAQTPLPERTLPKMTAFNDRDVMLGALVRALPYIQRYRDKAFVLQVEGAFCSDGLAQRQLAEQVGVLRALDIRVVLIHGPGPQLDLLAERLNLADRFVDGERVIDGVALDLQAMACAGMNSVGMVAAFRGAGVPAVGLTGIDAGLITAHQRAHGATSREGAHAEGLDLSGAVASVDARVLDTLLAGSFVPLICPLAADERGRCLALDAEQVSAEIAVALRAEKLIFLTEQRGLCAEPGNPESLISYVDLEGLSSLRVRGALDRAMQSKATAAAQALHNGVQRVHLIGCRPHGSLLAEIFTNEGSGTLIVADAAQAPGQ